MARQKKSIKIGYVLAYKSPDYIRTKTLLKALALVKNVTVTTAINKSKGTLRYIEALLALVKMRFRENPDIYVLGFRGHEIYPLVRLLTLGKKLIFDAMMSPYDALANERKLGIIGKVVSHIVYGLEYLILHSADLVLTDTREHEIMYQELFNLAPSKTAYAIVSTEEGTWLRQSVTSQLAEQVSFTIFYYATFVPLHGVGIVLRAAELLQALPIKFVIVGGSGRQLADFKSLAGELKLENITHMPWLKFDDLALYAQRSDLCLGGPFGGTGQSMRVITGKTYQFLAMGKPVVIGENPEVMGGSDFIDKSNCILVQQGCPEALAAGVMWAFEHRAKLRDIGDEARALYLRCFSIAQLAEQLGRLISRFSITD